MFIAGLMLQLTSELPLERFRVPVQRLAERRPDGAWVVADDDVRKLEAELAALLGIPAPWRLELRTSAWPTAGIERHSGSEFLETRLAGRFGVELFFATTLDAHWHSLDYATLFIARDGGTDFARTEFDRRTGFFALRAFPLLLSALDAELEKLELDGYELWNLDLETPQPLAPSPSIRCVMHVDDGGESRRFQATLNGLLDLPAEAAHERGFTFRRGPATGDSLSVVAQVSDSLVVLWRRAMAARSALPESNWTLDVQGGFSNSLGLVVGRLGDSAGRALAGSWPIELRAMPSSDPRRPDELGFALGELPIELSAARAFLEAVHAACGGASESVFSVTSCVELRRVDMLITPRTPPAELPQAGRGVSFTVSEQGELASQLPFTTGAVQATRASRIRLWTTVVERGDAIEWSLPAPMCCTQGEDLTRYATVCGRPAAVIGGAIVYSPPDVR